MNYEKKVLSIVIPCYNEEHNILALVKKVLESPIINKEIIVVDDCSKDGTRKVLEEEVKPLVSKIIYCCCSFFLTYNYSGCLSQN